MKGHKAYTVPYSNRKFSKMMETLGHGTHPQMCNSVWVFVDGWRLREPNEKVEYNRCTWKQFSNIIKDLDRDIEDYSLKAAAGAWQTERRILRIQTGLRQVLTILDCENMIDAPGAKDTRELVAEALLFFMAVEPEDV